MEKETNKSVAVVSDLREVCKLLNRHNVKYIVFGGYACILHGYIRTTEDVDILVESSEDNLQKVINALSELPEGAAKELTIKDLKENVVVKVVDKYIVDISIHAWKVSYEDAIKDMETVIVDDVKIPYAGIDSLIESKRTQRQPDIFDLQVLIRIREELKKKNKVG